MTLTKGYADQSTDQIVRSAKLGLTTDSFPFTEFSAEHKTEKGIFFHDDQKHANLYSKGVGPTGKFRLSGTPKTRPLAGGLEYIAENPNQIKSADPVTFSSGGGRR